MGQPVVHFEIIGSDPAALRSLPEPSWSATSPTPKGT